MDAVTLGLVGLRGVALTLSLQGQNRAADALLGLAEAIEAGADVDEHMALVADKLKSRNSNAADWNDVAKRIEDDSSRLQAANMAKASTTQEEPKP